MENAAGMDIVKVRSEFPKLQMIGGVDKLNIAKGPEGIDFEIDRVKKIINMGGYIPSFDHSVPPIIPYANYKYYIEKLKDALC